MTQVGKMLFDEGVEKGRREGISLGKLESRRHLALEMIKNNEPKEKILLYTHLDEDELQALINA